MSKYKGTVQKGARHGTHLGFPTANISLGDSTVTGIYAARVYIGEDEYFAAVFADQERGLLEAHLLDFPVRDLYGEEIEIELYDKVREAAEFSNEGSLRDAIADDIAKVRAYFKQ